MNPIVPSRRLEIGCDIAVTLAVILTGWKTAAILHELGIPLPKGEHRIDLNDEIESMAMILNLVLPFAAMALAISTAAKIHSKTLQPLGLFFNISSIAGIFACAASLYGLFAAMHLPVNLWSRIWWMFAP